MAKIGARTHKISAKRTLNGIKIKHRYQSTTVQIMLRLLAFCVSAVFAICPLARHATRYNLSATTTIIKLNTFYINAPAYIAGDTSRGADGAVNGSSISAENGTLLNTGTIPALFEAGGSINTTVLEDLLTMIDSCSTTADATGEVTYYSAKSFGAYDPKGNAQTSWDSTKKGNAQILVKLFETKGESNTDLNNFTSQYWQAVYRSVNGTNDVLTLYMVRPYTDAAFNAQYGQLYGGSYYYYDGNYSHSYLRDKTVIPMYNTLNTGRYFATQLKKYVVTPDSLPSSWQSSDYQMSFNNSKESYSKGGTGWSGWGANDNRYNMNNGLDGSGQKLSDWTSEVESAYTDKLWVPSAYEVIHTGYGSDENCKLKDTKRNYDGSNSVVYLLNYGTAGATAQNSNTNDNRTGLWELNGFDRATNSKVWSRSGSSDYRGNVHGCYQSGSEANLTVYEDHGVRVALHLDLGGLRDLLDTSSDAVLTINSNGGTLASGITSSATGEENETYSLPTASQLTKTGYTLNGYTLSGGGSLNGSTYTFGSTDGTVTAQWTAITYTIAYTLNGGVLANKREEYTIESDTYTLPTPTKTGYTFLGWTGSNGSSAQTTVTITKGTIGDKSYTANWESNYAEISLDVTINSNGRQYIIYILDENDNLKEQIMISKNGNSKIEIEKNKKFTILIYESLYMSATIDGETTRKKIYTNGASGAKTITITISSASGQVNNWVIV